MTEFFKKGEMYPQDFLWIIGSKNSCPTWSWELQFPCFQCKSVGIKIYRKYTHRIRMLWGGSGVVSISQWNGNTPEAKSLEVCNGLSESFFPLVLLPMTDPSVLFSHVLRVQKEKTWLGPERNCKKGLLSLEKSFFWTKKSITSTCQSLLRSTW